MGAKPTLVGMTSYSMMHWGINAALYTQAANSPDVNLLDLGFFRAIQSFNDAAPKNKKGQIETVSEV